MKHELVVQLLDIGMVVGSSLEEPKLNFIFAKLSFDLTMEG